MLTGRREDPTKCGKGLHDWIEENIYTTPSSGIQACRPCRNESRKKPEEERHPLGAGHCRRGHAYTPENTRKVVRFIGGTRTIARICIACESLRKRTGFRR
jgi:hypothetical protein